jgi:hypothetical protein
MLYLVMFTYFGGLGLVGFERVEVAVYNTLSMADRDFLLAVYEL